MSLKTHNILDYVAGAVAILCSSAVGSIPAARDLFLAAGVAQIAYSLFTNYRYSVARLIPVGVHMILDCLAGLALLVGPWVFRYSGGLSRGQIALHVILGAGILALVGFTRRRTESGWDTVRRDIESKRVERDLETAGRR
jgi:hypothetical protein